MISKSFENSCFIPDISMPTAIITSIVCCNFSAMLFFQYQNWDLRKEWFFANPHKTSSTMWGVEHKTKMQNYEIGYESRNPFLTQIK